MSSGNAVTSGAIRALPTGLSPRRRSTRRVPCPRTAPQGRLDDAMPDAARSPCERTASDGRSTVVDAGTTDVVSLLWGHGHYGHDLTR